MSNLNLYDLFMAVVCLWAYLGVLQDGRRQGERSLHWAVAFSAVLLFCYYLMLALKAPLADDLLWLRDVLFRPALAAFLIGIGLIMMDGRLTEAMRWLSRWRKE